MATILPTQFSIPNSQKPLFRKILTMSDAVMVEFIAALRDSRPSAKTENYVEDVASKVNDIDAEDVGRIIILLASLYRFRDTSGLSVAEIANGLTNALNESESENLSETDAETFRNRLSKLLSLDASLGVTIKAANVLVQHEHAFSSARIITDIRPVFASGDVDKPAATVIVHMLKISYKEGDADRDFFVALDSDDLSLLRSVVERAEAKQKGIRKMVQAWDVPYLDLANPTDELVN